MKLEKNSEIFKSISYRYKFLVGARDPIKKYKNIFLFLREIMISYMNYNIN